MSKMIQINHLSNLSEVQLLQDEFEKYYPWFIKSDYHINCLHENQIGTRVTLLAYIDHNLAGCCHLLYKSSYPHFSDQNIPEINDLNVFPTFRKKGVATRLLDELYKSRLRIRQMNVCNA